MGISYFVNGDLDQAQQLLTRCLGHTANKFDAQQPSESLLAWIKTRLYLATILLRRGTPDLNVLKDVEEAIATLSSRDLLNDSAIQSRAQFAWLKSQALTDQTASEKAQLLLAESIARHSSVPHEYRNAAWSFWLGRLYAAKARIEHRSSHDTESQESMAKRVRVAGGLRRADKRWTVHAAFELFESWLHTTLWTQKFKARTYDGQRDYRRPQGTPDGMVPGWPNWPITKATLNLPPGRKRNLSACDIMRPWKIVFSKP